MQQLQEIASIGTLRIATIEKEAMEKSALYQA